MVKNLRYLWLHSNYDSWMSAWHEHQIRRWRAHGFDIEIFRLKPDAENDDVYYFPRLDRLWRRGDSKLLRMYEALARKLEGKDVLIHFNGVNIHPEFIDQLDVFKVYHCADDPESTEIVSKPVATHYDIQLVSNIAEVERYRSWGLKNAYFLPLGSLTNEEDVAHITEEMILDINRRTIPIAFFGAFGGVYLSRAKRMSSLANAFPEAYCAGAGWKRGFADWNEMWSTYRQTQIGWNVHNSTGPINYRLYDLPAYGVMQICDNKAYLGEVFKIDREVVGFDTIEECIELTRYYLAHPQEQREIALAGWQRWRRDYTPDRVFDRIIGLVDKHFVEPKNKFRADVIQVHLAEHEKRTQSRRRLGRVEDRFRRQLAGIIRPVRRFVAAQFRKYLYSVRQ